MFLKNCAGGVGGSHRSLCPLLQVQRRLCGCSVRVSGMGELEVIWTLNLGLQRAQGFRFRVLGLRFKVYGLGLRFRV